MDSVKEELSNDPALMEEVISDIKAVLSGQEIVEEVAEPVPVPISAPEISSPAYYGEEDCEDDEV